MTITRLQKISGAVVRQITSDNPVTLDASAPLQTPADVYLVDCVSISINIPPVVLGYGAEAPITKIVAKKAVGDPSVFVRQNDGTLIATLPALNSWVDLWWDTNYGWTILCAGGP